MATKLTPKQQVVLDTVHRLTEIDGNAPTLKRLKDELGLGQLSSVQRHVEALRFKGALPTAKPWQRGVETSNAEVRQLPLVGAVACGTPLLAEEQIEARIPYSTSRLKSSTAQYFFLRARGDSMDQAETPAPISEGDLLLVRQQQEAKAGQTVVALIGDDATCKVLETTPDGWFSLSPRSSNAVHKPRIMLEDFTILGVVEDVVRPPQSGI